MPGVAQIKAELTQDLVAHGEEGLNPGANTISKDLIAQSDSGRKAGVYFSGVIRQVDAACSRTDLREGTAVVGVCSAFDGSGALAEYVAVPEYWCVSTQQFLCACVRVCMCARACVRVYACMYMCACACVRVRACVRVCESFSPWALALGNGSVVCKPQGVSFAAAAAVLPGAVAAYTALQLQRTLTRGDTVLLDAGCDLAQLCVCVCVFVCLCTFLFVCPSVCLSLCLSL